MSQFVQSIDTPGGHVLVCFLAIAVGAGLYLLKVPKGEELISVAAGALFMAMRGLGAKNGGTAENKS